MNDYTGGLEEDGKGNVWAATKNGLGRYDPITGRFTNFVHDPENTCSLPINKLGSVHEDQKGRIWITSDGAGLSRYDPVQDCFINYQFKLPGATEEESQFLTRIPSVVTDTNGLIWLGSHSRKRAGQESLPKKYLKRRKLRQVEQPDGRFQNIGGSFLPIYH